VVSSGTTGLARFRSVSAHNMNNAGVNRIIRPSQSTSIRDRSDGDEKTVRKIGEGKNYEDDENGRSTSAPRPSTTHATSEIKSKKLSE